MRKILDIILYLWQLPQNLLGLLLVAWFHPEGDITFRGVKILYSCRMRGGISLGKYIIVNAAYYKRNGDTELHEYGHSLQSRMLGPLYLFVVGIPSLLWAVSWTDRSGDYYAYWTERWADKLGGVDRC